MMNVQFQIREVKDNDRLRRQLAADLEDLNRRIAVASARVSLQRQPEIIPPYQAVVVLALSGPDIHAAARDYTWPAAWRKVVTRLRGQIEERRSRQTARQKGQPRIPTPSRKAGAKAASI
jgi:Sigma 54 modulation protein / S30EA ribosomal protein